MKKVWCIDIGGLVHDIEFAVYEEHDIEYYLTKSLDEVDNDLQLFGKEATVLVVQASFQVDGEFLDQLPQLQGICTLGMGFNNINLDEAKARHITVSNVPDYSTTEVADHTVTLALSAIRDIKRFDQEVHKGIWNPTMKTPIRRLSTLTYGLIGFGKIAQEVAKRLVAFGFTIIAFDKYAPKHVFTALDVQSVELEELWQRADVISLHVPLTTETANLIDKEALMKMKKNVIIINTSRGGTIEEKALELAVESGQILRVALDVLKEEPPQIHHPLLKYDQVMITPHAAYLSVEAEQELQTKTAENVVRIVNGQLPLNIVNG